MISLILPSYSFGATGTSSEGTITGTVPGDCLYLGKYPQREVVKTESQSGVYGRSWANKNDYIVNESLYTSLKNASWDANGDTTVSGEKYHRIKKSDASYTYNYENFYYWEDDTTYHYFKYEPIKWKILKRSATEAVVISDVIIDNLQYNARYVNDTWSGSTIREWLNGDFYNNYFSQGDKDIIKESALTNSENSLTHVSSGSATTDKIYLPAESDLSGTTGNNYGFKKGPTDADSARMVKSSTYAKAMGAYAETNKNIGYGKYWTRTQGDFSFCAAFVESSGEINMDGDLARQSVKGIRPMVLVDISDEDKVTYERKNVTIDGSNVTLDKTEFVYDGTAKTPVVTVKGLPEGSYKVDIVNNVDQGQGQVIVTGQKKFSGTITKVFDIKLIIPGKSGKVVKHIQFDTVYFGTYPQREVVASKSFSGTYQQAWATNDDCIVDAALFEKLEKAYWNVNDDATVDGVKYHRLSKSTATYKGSSDKGTYYKWSDNSTFHYFKYEPIKWRIIKNKNNEMLLLADKALDCQRYNVARNDNAQNPVTWEDSTVRGWLNSKFYDTAFGNMEKIALKETFLLNRNNYEYNVSGGIPTKDKVFLLEEGNLCYITSKNYSSELPYDEARQMQSTTFAKAMGTFASADKDTLGNCHWWLRSPGFDQYHAAYVDVKDQVVSQGGAVYTSYNGVIPAITVDTTVAKPESAGTTGTIKEIVYDDMTMADEQFIFAGQEVKPEVSILGLAEGIDYEVTYENNDKLGIGKVTVTGKGECTGSVTKYFAIVSKRSVVTKDGQGEKPQVDPQEGGKEDPPQKEPEKEKVTPVAQTIKISKTSYTYKVADLKKAAKTVTLKPTASGKGTISYKVTKGTTANITVAAKGKVTLKKKCKKGTYKVTITAAATKDGKYKKATKVITFTVK